MSALMLVRMPEHRLICPISKNSSPDVCGRSLECKQNLHSVLNVVRVLTCVRPLVATVVRRGPIWEFADQVQHAHAHSRCRPAELVFLIPSLDRLSISFVRPAYTRNGGLEILSARADLMLRSSFPRSGLRLS
nr:hypothetical protein BDDEJBFL_00236 [Agrobacterium fabrum]